MDRTQIGKEIRKQLGNLGITSKQVSVTKSRGSAVNVTIKDLRVNLEDVKEIAHKYESVRRCEYSGEILSGGNTYVFVNFDWSVVRNETEKLLDTAKDIINKYQGQDGGFDLYESGNLVVIYWPKATKGGAQVTLSERPEGYKEMNSYALREIDRRWTSDAFSLAEALVIYKYQYLMSI